MVRAIERFNDQIRSISALLRLDRTASQRHLAIAGATASAWENTNLQIPHHAAGAALLPTASESSPSTLSSSTWQQQSTLQQLGACLN